VEREREKGREREKVGRGSIGRKSEGYSEISLERGREMNSVRGR